MLKRFGPIAALLAILGGIAAAHAGAVSGPQSITIQTVAQHGEASPSASPSHDESHPTKAPQVGSFTFTKIASPQDPTFTQLLGINGGNTIAGYFGSGATGHPNKGFTLNLPNHFTSENFPNSAQTQVIAINARGDTGGFYIDQGGATHGFTKVNGSFRTVDLPGTTFDNVLGLDNRGQAAGFFQDAAGQDHAWVRDAHGNFIVPPIANSQATGINDDGTVVGFTTPAQNQATGFVLRDNVMRSLSYPGSTFTQPLGENNEGQIVGTFNDAQGNAHGFVYAGGTFHKVDVPGGSATTINGINDRGRIVGFFTDAAGNTVGFVGSPANS